MKKIFFCLLLIALFLSGAAAPPVVHGGTGRSVAIVDFDSGSGTLDGPGSAWISSAVVELLHAKMQLFEGCRLVERSRLRSILPLQDEKGGGEEERLARFLSIVPAEIIVLGSTTHAEVDGKDLVKIRVRAVETATSRILSDTAYGEVSDLPGLLDLAERAARQIAAGLDLAYTPEQLHYAEPRRIDALTFHLEGNDHLANRRYREAVEAYQRALDGNGGRFYPAAHSAQGEAYRLLAGENAGAGADDVRQEYLEKFRRDALLASSALFDLGLAYEANEMWSEAAETYGDYISAVGKEGSILRWGTDIPKAGGTNGPGFLLEGDRRLHVVDEMANWASGTQKSWFHQWFTFDLDTGEMVRRVTIREMKKLLGADGRILFRLIGFDGPTILAWWKNVPGRTGHIVALSPSLEILWQREIAEFSAPSDQACGGGMIYLLTWDGIMTLDGKDGSVLSVVDGQKEVSRKNVEIISTKRKHRKGISTTREQEFQSRLDREKGLWTAGGGQVYDLATGRIVRRLEGSGLHRPSGREGLHVLDNILSIRAYHGGEEVLHLEDSIPILFDSPPQKGSPLLFRQSKGFVLFDTGDLTVAKIRDSTVASEPPLAAGVNPFYAVLVRKDQDMMEVYDQKAGLLLGKISSSPDKLKYFLLLDRDILYMRDSKIFRIRAVPEGERGIIPVPVARLHLAAALMEGGDLAGAREQAVLVDGELPGDFRGMLLHMAVAGAEGNREKAATWARKALATGELGPKERALAIETMQAFRPEVLDAIATPVRSRLAILSMSESGVLVCTTEQDRDMIFHVLVDTVKKKGSVLRTPLLRSAWHMIYRNRYAYAVMNEAPFLIRYDFLTGEVLESDTLHERAVWEKTFHLGTRSFDEAIIEFHDPETLEVTATAGIAGIGKRTLLLDERRAVLDDPVDDNAVSAGVDRLFTVVDRTTGEVLGRVVVTMNGNEVVRGLALDGTRLYFTTTGMDWERFRSEGGGHRYRVAAYDVESGDELWVRETEGWAASNPVVESDEVIFIAHEGPFSGHAWEEYMGGEAARFDRMPRLSKIYLDRGTGELMRAEPVPLSRTEKSAKKPWRQGRRGFTFLSRNLYSNGSTLVGRYNNSFIPRWRPSPGARPVGIAPESLGLNYVVGGNIGIPHIGTNSVTTYSWGSVAQLYRDGKVFESIGGGVIVVKDLAYGAGAEPLVPPPGRF